MVEGKVLYLQGKPTDMRTAMHYTNATALVELSHRGSRVESHAAAAMRQPYMSTVSGEVCYTYKTAMIAAGGLAGGVSSSIAGGEFIVGLCNGLICAGLNHALHYVAKGVTGPDDPPGKQNTGANTGSRNVEKLKEDLMKGGQAGGGVATAVDGAASRATMNPWNTLSITSKVIGGVFVLASEIPDLIDFAKDPNLGTGAKLVIGVGLGVATVFGSPVVATGAFVLGVVNAYGGFDSYYDQLNNLNIHDTQNTK